MHHGVGQSQDLKLHICVNDDQGPPEPGTLGSEDTGEGDSWELSGPDVSHDM